MLGISTQAWRNDQNQLRHYISYGGVQKFSLSLGNGPCNVAMPNHAPLSRRPQRDPPHDGVQRVHPVRMLFVVCPVQSKPDGHDHRTTLSRPRSGRTINALPDVSVSQASTELLADNAGVVCCEFEARGVLFISSGNFTQTFLFGSRINHLWCFHRYRGRSRHQSLSYRRSDRSRSNRCCCRWLSS